jgi:hypothetical protein
MFASESRHQREQAGEDVNDVVSGVHVKDTKQMFIPGDAGNKPHNSDRYKNYTEQQADLFMHIELHSS